MAGEAPQIADEDIQAAQEAGQRSLTKQTTAPRGPRFSFPELSGSPGARDALLTTLLGLHAGTEASGRVNQYGSPLVSFLAGAAGAAGAPNAQDMRAQRASQIAQAQMKLLEVTPVTAEMFPEMVAKYPEVEGMPLGVIEKILPVFQRSELMTQNALQFAGKMGLENRKLQALIPLRAWSTMDPTTKLVLSAQGIGPLGSDKTIGGEEAAQERKVETEKKGGAKTFTKEQVQKIIEEDRKQRRNVTQ